MKKRLFKVVRNAGIILVAGLLYAYIMIHTEFAIPCIIHSITGWYCPGCGVSRMCISLIHFNFVKAFWYNPGVMICLPFLFYIIISMIYGYIKNGEYRLSGKQSVLVWVLTAFLIIFGIVRNLPGFTFLIP